MARKKKASASKKRASGQHYVVLIHGTYSKETAADSAKNWWEVGSAFRNELARALGLHAGAFVLTEPFKWSGENSERARSDAGRDLLVELRRLEADKQPYHLVGHSHGGSVMWIALREAAGRHLSLEHLKSWTTVGTPFLHVKNSTQDSTTGMPVKLFLLILTVTCLLYVAWDRFVEIMTTKSNASLSIAALFLFFMIWSKATFRYLHSADMDLHFSRDAMVHHGTCWLGLRSPDDEAVNGLIQSLSVGGRVIPRFATAPRDLVRAVWDLLPWGALGIGLAVLFHPESVWWLLPAVLLTAAAVPALLAATNRLLLPAGDRFIWRQVARKLQGSDRPRAPVVGVSAGPMPTADGWGYPLLPESVSTAIRAEADRHLTTCAPGLRDLLAPSALEELKTPGLVPDFVGKLSGKELVHTSYFDNPDVVRLIANHLVSSSGLNLKGTLPCDLADWYGHFRDEVRRNVLDQIPTPPRSWIARAYRSWVPVDLGESDRGRERR